MSLFGAESHTYAPDCRLAPLTYPADPNPDTHGIPVLVAQFFYSSVIPIDDPLALAAAPDAKPTKAAPLRPFSRGDNNALEKAWLSFASDEDRRDHMQALQGSSPNPASARAVQDKIDAICRHLVCKHTSKHLKEGLLPSQPTTPGDASLVCCAELRIDASDELKRAFCALARRRWKGLDEDTVIDAVMAELQKSLPLVNLSRQPNRSKSASVSSAIPFAIGSIPSIMNNNNNNEPGSAASSLPATRIRRPERWARADGDVDSRGSSVSRNHNQMSPAKSKPPPRPPPFDDGIVGKPFLRVGSPEPPIEIPSSSLGSVSRSPDDESKPPSRDGKSTDGDVDLSHRANQSDSTNPVTADPDLPPSANDLIAWELRGQPVDVTVGVSRLHMVSLPLLEMKPIYWSPINDIAIVLRATWFYRDTMTPVEPKVANQLEAGYRELCPWSEAWSDELRCAVEVGALGEEKVAQPLWPPPPQSTKHQNLSKEEPPPVEPRISDDPYCASRCFQGDAAAEGSLDSVRKTAADAASKTYANHYVIYKNAREAYLLKPSLKPSAYYGRRPVSKIVKGTDVGLPVVRGFDRDAWVRLHEGAANKAAAAAAAAQAVRQYHARDPASSRRGPGAGAISDATCPACKAEVDRWRVDDLVLVAHGIGQKFAERVESFHFTHAINAFRRAVNVELGNEHLRRAMGSGSGCKNGIMVLPVNWRHKLSLEDGGPEPGVQGTPSAQESFGLKDIEPKTIPAVRSMISDIMFDIPFYMSQHKPKMVQALVGEANRVYRLWCLNNPGFAEQGRVHLVAHSLGSAMALEVLSNQPTKTPPFDDLSLDNGRHFAFDTVNLFLLGSPAGFFLLLERGHLLPRRGRRKPGADPEDVLADDLVGEQGQFGCLAVDNIYNVLAREDPIAYLLNGTIDPVYAASLKPAFVPTTATGVFQSIGNGIKSLWGGGGGSAGGNNNSSSQRAGGAASPARPSATTRLPSQLELEVHDFTREETAERKAYLLNDNGQIDYYLRSGGGPLEIQYLNMLSAHSSYWNSHDLVRMLCMEIGRRPGRANTYPVMRAQKASKRIIPSSFSSSSS